MRRRRERPMPKPWKYDHRNPQMVVVTRILEETPSGMLVKRHVEMKPEEYQQLCQESLLNSTNPIWDKDKSYF